MSVVLDRHLAAATWTCDACTATTTVPLACSLADPKPPRAWAREESGDLCGTCRFHLILVGLLGHYHRDEVTP
jgi:hypothetical protein